MLGQTIAESPIAGSTTQTQGAAMPKLTAAVAAATAGSTSDLTVIGTADWLFAGTGDAANANARKNVAPLITLSRLVGTGDSYFDPGLHVSSWSDGTPNVTGSSSTAKYVGLNLNGAGYSMTIPAGTGQRTFTLVAGMYNGTMRVSATLSDGSATMADVVWTAGADVDQRKLTFTYSAAADGQTLTISMRTDTASGAVHFHSAALSTAGAVVTPTVPSAPTIGTAVAGDGYIDVAFTRNSDGGSAVLDSTATLSTGQTATGTTSPIRVTAPNGTPATATVKDRNAVGLSPASAASNSVTPSSAGGGSNPSQISIIDAKLAWSPYNWDDRSAYKSSNTPGAFVNAAFTGTAFSVKVDVSHLVAAGVSASSYPTISVVIDGWNVVDTKLTSSSTIISRTGLSSGAHTAEVLFNATDPSVARFGATLVNAVRITGFTIDAGGTLTQAASLPSSIAFSDSTGEGWAALNIGAPAGNSARHTTWPIIGKALGEHIGTVCFSGIGFQEAGYDVPKIINSFGFYSSGRSRLVGGLFSPQPRNIFCELGANGLTFQSDVEALITAFRAAAPNAHIFIMVPAGGFARAAITAAVAAKSADARLHLADLGVEYQAGIDRGPGNQQTLYSVDGLHRNALCNGRVAGGYISLFQEILGGVATPTLTQRNFTIRLATGKNLDDTLIYASNLSSLKVSHHDGLPGASGVARYESSAETTDANGYLAYSCACASANGHVTVIGPNGLHYNAAVVAS